MNIIPYSSVYLKQVEKITVATSSKAASDPIHRQFTLAMYCDGYLAHGIVYLLEDSQHIFGYIMCAPDFSDYFKNTVPQQEIISSLPAPYPQRAAHEWQNYRRYEENYPAHMHIDLIKKVRGQHYGTALIRKLLKTLKGNNVKGIMLGVGKSNKRAIHFYIKNGFTILEDDNFSYLMGLRL